MKSPTDPRTRGAAQALVVLLLGCHARAVTGQPLDAPSVPLEAPLRVCESPAGRAALARLPGAAPCGQRAMNLVSVSLPAGPLDVLARAGDPCCTDTGDVLWMPGVQVWLGGQPYRPEAHRGRGYWEGLAPFGALSVQARGRLMQSLVLVQGGLDAAYDASGAASLVRAWPEAGGVVSRTPPGVRAERGRWVLTAWSTRTEHERGVQCRFLTRHTVQLTQAGQLSAMPEVVYATGQRLGAPCGDPLPSR